MRTTRTQSQEPRLLKMLCHTMLLLMQRPRRARRRRRLRQRCRAFTKCIYMHMNTYYSSRAGVYSSLAGAAEAPAHGGRSRARRPKQSTAAEAACAWLPKPQLDALRSRVSRVLGVLLHLRRMLPRPTGQSCLCTAGDLQNVLLTQMQLHNHLCPISRIGQCIQRISCILVFP